MHLRLVFDASQMQPIRGDFFAFFLIALLAGIASPARSEVPSELEPSFAEAVLAYRQDRPAEALQKLVPLLRQAPSTLEFLELKALALKSTKNDPESANTYQEIIQQKTSAKAPNSELAPYRFELGLIRFRQMDYSGARGYLEQALAESFNAGPSNYFLGMIHFQLGNLETAAQHFRGAIESGILELTPVSYFFLAQIALKASNPTEGIDHFVRARDISKSVIDKADAPPSAKEAATQILNASNKALETLDHNTWFGSVTVLGGYDSNVLTYPDSVATSSATGKQTAKLALQAGIGYATSPIKAFQLVPSLRSIANYNLNRESRSGEYLTNVLSLSANRRPLEKTVFGLRLDLPLTFQNQPLTPTSSSKYRVLNFGGSLGPTFRRQFNNRLTGTAESMWGYLKYPGDTTATSESIQRSGLTNNSRLALNWDLGSRWFNPGVSANYQSTQTKGTEYRNRNYGLGVQNLFHLFEEVRLIIGATGTYTSYYARVPSVREDKTILGYLNGLWNLNRKFAIMGDASFTSNGSTEKATYQYGRFTVAAGLSYNLF